MAYAVVAVQIKSTIEHDGRKRNSTNYTQLPLKKAQLTNNLNILSQFKEDFSSGEAMIALSSLSRSNWARCSSNLGTEVKDETIIKMQSCYIKTETYSTSQTIKRIDITDDIITTINNTLILIRIS